MEVGLSSLQSRDRRCRLLRAAAGAVRPRHRERHDHRRHRRARAKRATWRSATAGSRASASCLPRDGARASRRDRPRRRARFHRRPHPRRRPGVAPAGRELHSHGRDVDRRRQLRHRPRARHRRGARPDQGHDRGRELRDLDRSQHRAERGHGQRGTGPDAARAGSDAVAGVQGDGGRRGRDSRPACSTCRGLTQSPTRSSSWRSEAANAGRHLCHAHAERRDRARSSRSPRPFALASTARHGAGDLAPQGRQSEPLGRERGRRWSSSTTQERAGLEVEADQYAYTAASSSLSIRFPSWALEGGTESVRTRLRDPETWARIKKEMAGALRRTGILRPVVGRPWRAIARIRRSTGCR